MIYQLLKTSPYLTGQVRLDLVTDRMAGDQSLTLDEVHVVPIDDTIWYNCPEDQINFRHSDNIVSLYKAIEDRFYSAGTKASLRGKYPYYSVDGSDTDTVDHTYQAGLRRLSSARYGKDMSFLLPMWIDEDIVDRLTFQITVYPCSDTEDQIPLTSKALDMSDRLKKYLSDWFDGVNSDLVYIGLRDSKAYMTGVEANTGSLVTKDISSLIGDLLYRERPILETDNMITRKFSENKIVSRQLMNFNFVFSMEDLFSPAILETILWNPVNVTVEARVDNKPVETKDLYTNYTDIYSYKISSNPIGQGTFVESMSVAEDGSDTDTEPAEKKFNVLDYLDDDKCIDLMYRNKMVQPDFHWSFADNPKYTWNLYNGFSPIVEDSEGIVRRVEGRFFSTPDVISSEYSIYNNNIGWMTVVDGTKDLFPSATVLNTMTSSYTTKFSPNKYGTFWSNGIKFNMKDVLERSGEALDIELDSIRANICFVRYIEGSGLDKDKIYVAAKRKNGEDYLSVIAVVEGDIHSWWGFDYLTYQGVKSCLSVCLEQASDEEYASVFGGSVDEYSNLMVMRRRSDTGSKGQHSSPEYGRKLTKIFYSVLETIEYPSVVRFYRSLAERLAPAPSIDKLVKDGYMSTTYTDEIEYYSIDNGFVSYMFRYGGNIIPQFIDTKIEYTDSDPEEGIWWKTVSSGAFNMVYRKTQFKDLSSAERNVLNYINNQGYSPDYPSVGYFYIEGDKQDTDKPFVPEGYLGELTWFFKNKTYFVPDEFTVTCKCTSEEMTDEKILDMFVQYGMSRGYFKNLASKGEEELARTILERYLYKLYRHSSDWEYSSIDSIDDYDFTVTYSLA